MAALPPNAYSPARSPSRPLARANVRVQRHGSNGQARKAQDFGVCDISFDADAAELSITTVLEGKALFLPMEGGVSVEMKMAQQGKMSIIHRKHSLVIMLAGSTHFELACVACAMAGRPLPRKLRRKARTAPSPTLLLASPTAAASRPRPQSAPTPPASAAVELSARQKSVIRAVLAGKSVFFTGPAGSGKSLLLRQLIHRLPPATTAVTASTGIAACNIGGVTLHSWAGMGRAYSSTPAADIARAIRRRRDVLGRWLATRVLVVDEVSMVEGPFLDKLEAVAREVRSSSAAFGGIQLVLVGDFYQLPPVASKAEQVPFAFQAAAWKRCIQHNIQLTDVFRQAHGEFVDILNEAREGSISPASLDVLNSRWGVALDCAAAGIAATKLMTHKGDVDARNAAQLKSLPGEALSFAAADVATSGKPGHLAMLKANCRARDTLLLKAGAQVMLIKSISPAEGLVNGTRGVVKEFTKGATPHPVVQFGNGVLRTIRPVDWNVSVGGATVATRRQLPLDLAWALSIHKSQGMTLDAVEVSLGRVFECGQAYVALSRCRSLEGLSLVDRITADSIRAHPDVQAFYAQLQGAEALHTAEEHPSAERTAAPSDVPQAKGKRTHSARVAMSPTKPPAGRAALAPIQGTTSGTTPEKKRSSVAPPEECSVARTLVL